MTHSKFNKFMKAAKGFREDHLRNRPLETDGEYFSDTGERIPNPNPPIVNPIAAGIFVAFIIAAIVWFAASGFDANAPYLRCGVKSTLVTCGDEAFSVDSVTSLEIVEHQSNLYIYTDGTTKPTNAIVLRLKANEMKKIIDAVVKSNPEVRKPEGADLLVLSKSK